MKKIIIAITAMFALTANAQDEVEVSAGADVVSKYVWRGAECGHAAVQPSLGVAYKGVSLNAWGSYGITDSNDAEEFDLTLSYTTGGLTVGVTDYWFSGGSRYFMYESHKTAHVFEANIGYDFGVASVNWYTNFAGNDGVNKDGDRAYSSYVEVAAPFKLGGCDWTAKVGAVPYATTSYEGINGFAITNISLRAAYDVKITDKFALPLFAEVTANPAKENAFFAVGLTISK